MSKMQPLKITIYGDFWDCQIYRDRLYLWYMDGSVGVYKWEELVEENFADILDRDVLQYAFTRGNTLYRKNAFENVSQQVEIKSKFLEASKKNLSIDADDLKRFEFSLQEDPIGELPTDTCIYNSVLFAVIDSGLYSTSVHDSSSGLGVSRNVNKLWDCQLISIRASRRSRSLAMAGGEEGVFELHLYNYSGDISNLEKVDNEIYRVSERHSSLVDWSFASLYSSSYVDSGFLVAFGWNQNEITRKYNRVFKRVISGSEIFHKSGYSWGCQEKLYLANCETIEVIKYTQKNIDSNGDGEAFRHLESIRLSEPRGNVVSAGVAYFGTVIEYDNALIVLCSDDELVTLSGSVARWRVYPRSFRYENHLHAVYEDRLVIYSFVNDYFVDQRTKTRGIEYREDPDLGTGATAKFDYA